MPKKPSIHLDSRRDDDDGSWSVPAFAGMDLPSIYWAVADAMRGMCTLKVLSDKPSPYYAWFDRRTEILGPGKSDYLLPLPHDPTAPLVERPSRALRLTPEEATASDLWQRYSRVLWDLLGWPVSLNLRPEHHRYHDAKRVLSSYWLESGERGLPVPVPPGWEGSFPARPIQSLVDFQVWLKLQLIELRFFKFCDDPFSPRQLGRLVRNAYRAAEALSLPRCRPPHSPPRRMEHAENELMRLYSQSRNSRGDVGLPRGLKILPTGKLLMDMPFEGLWLTFTPPRIAGRQPEPSNRTPRGWISIKDTALVIDKSPSRASRLVKDGTLRCTGTGKATRVDPASIVQYLLTQRQRDLRPETAAEVEAKFRRAGLSAS